MAFNLFADPNDHIETRLQDARALLASLADDSLPLLVTDPPYGISYQSNHRKEGKSAPIAADWEFQIHPFFHELSRVLQPGGAAYVFTRWDVYPDWARAVPSGLEIKNFIIWNKNNHSAGDLSGNFGFKYEGLMFLVKGRHRLRGSRWPNVWDFPRVSATHQIHPAEKPVALLQRAIEASSDPGDLVVDPFCGSGSTGEAALLSGRRSLLGEIDKRVLRAARKRLGLTEDPNLLDPPTSNPPTDRDMEVCLDVLEGLHPEDLLVLAEMFNERLIGRGN